MKQYEVVKEFPGLKIGDILTEDEGTGFYVNYKEDIEITEDSESKYVNSLAINEEAILENLGEYFKELIDEKDVMPASTKEVKIGEMMQVASLLESDLVTSINEYHTQVLHEAISRIYGEVNLINSID